MLINFGYPIYTSKIDRRTTRIEWPGVDGYGHVQTGFSDIKGAEKCGKENNRGKRENYEEAEAAESMPGILDLGERSS